MKKAIATLIATATVVVAFYVTVFCCIRYKTDKVIPEQTLSNAEIKRTVTSETKGLSEDEIIRWCRRYTCRHLSFSLKSASNDIDLPQKHEEHCVGYSAFFSATLNLAFRSNGIDCRCVHARGRLFFLGIDLNSLLSDRNFRDHDYCIVKHDDGETAIIDILLIDILVPAFIL